MHLKSLPAFLLPSSSLFFFSAFPLFFSSFFLQSMTVCRLNTGVVISPGIFPHWAKKLSFVQGPPAFHSKVEKSEVGYCFLFVSAGH